MVVGIVFVRGINVGGKNALPMSVLRAACDDAGLRDVRTYIQSGNVVGRASKGVLSRAARIIEHGIEKRRGFRPGVVVRTLDDLRVVADGNPFADRRGLKANKVLVMFLSGDPDPGAEGVIGAIKGVPERVRIVGREAYLFMPNGAGKAKLSMARIESALGVPGTCRNWNTIEKVLAMAEELNGAG